ncbi:MAG: CNNM domain-containing protein [Phycisphaerales bacterium]
MTLRPSRRAHLAVGLIIFAGVCIVAAPYTVLAAPPIPPAIAPAGDATPELAIAAGEAITAASETNPWALLVFYLALALCTSFLCSLLEASFLSIPRSYAQVLTEQGRESGRHLDAMKENVDRPLAAILTLNTIANTIGATGVGAMIQQIFGNAAVAAGSIVVTLMILVCSEIIPKTLGAVHAKRLAPFMVATVRIITVLTYPLVRTLELISRFLSSGADVSITRGEIASVAEMGQTAGVLGEGESRVIGNLLKLDVIRVSDIMTPRPVVFMLDQTMTVEQALAAHDPIPFSRILVHRENPDEIEGMVLRHDLYTARWEGRGDRPLSAFIKPIKVIPSVATVTQAFEQFTARRVHIMLVVDEFGGTAGCITLEDAVESLLGIEIVDETDDVADMRSLARQRMELMRRQRDAREAQAAAEKLGPR